MTTFPNILWLVGEDCPPRFGCYGDHTIATPAIDALAYRGTLFEQAFSVAPVCAPSRFALLTGIRPECHSPADRMRAHAVRPDWMTTYPEVLRRAGYYCTNNAKTDYNLEVDVEQLWHESSRTAHWRNRGDGQPFLAVFNFDPTHESTAFDDDSPLLTELRSWGSHVPIPPRFDPPVSLETVRVPAYLPDTHEVRSDIATYYGAIGAFDDFVAARVSELAESGLLDDTIIVLTSDHGGVAPRSKRYLYDEGLHVPLIVSVPDQFTPSGLTPGTRRTEPTTTVSLAPTVLSLAGVDIPQHMAGPPLTSGGDSSRYAFGARSRMDERFGLSRTVRDARYRYIRNYTPRRPTVQHQAFAWNAAAFRSWESGHLASSLNETQEKWWRDAPPVELYDVDQDPDEVLNLAGSPAHSETESRLAAALRQHMVDIHDNGFLPEDSSAMGWDASRIDENYPLERVLSVADMGLDARPDNLPSLIEALCDENVVIARWGAIGILRQAEHAHAAIPALLTAIRDSVDSVKIPAAEALARISDSDDAYLALADLTEPDHNYWSRLEAINALTFLPLDRVRTFRPSLNQGPVNEEYLNSAMRYLELRLENRYFPDAAVFAAQSPPRTRS
ncbi:sulfatase-like hydrolase/transferase [Gordonia malaquae]|uniref:sulfatase-like hydrolase/transferase n=1 Tax=Gordonia malaquae TaxID=410332 RepID=UPI0030FED7C9